MLCGLLLTFGPFVNAKEVVYGDAPILEDAPCEVTITLDQRGIIGEDRQTKLFGGASRYLPTGVYKKPDEPLVITVSDTDQKTYPQVVISDPILSHYVDGNKDGIQLKKGRNVISVPGGGVVHLINESPKTSNPPKVTIEGGYRFTYFVLGEHSIENWREMLVKYKDIPAIELVGERVFITASYDTAKDIDDPVQLLKYIDEAIEVENRVSGLDDCSVDPLHRPSQYRQHMRENNSPGTYMYMFTNHTGYNSDALKTILNTHHFTKNGWGPWHEFGHTYQQHPWRWDGLGEVTVNIYSLSVERHFGNNSRLEKEGRYESAFAYFNQPYRNYNGIDDVFVKLVMFWQLDLAFGEEFYPMLHRVYREVPEAEQPKTDNEKIQQFIISASEVANCNLTPFFEMWGLSPTRETKKRISQLPDLTEPIWRLTDAGYVFPPVYLRAEDVLGSLGSLAGATLTDATPIRVEAPDILVAGVEVAVDGKIVYQGESVPTDLVLRPSEFEQGNRSISVVVSDDRDRRYTYTTSFKVEHFDLVAPRGAEQEAKRLSGGITVEVEPVIPADDFIDVSGRLKRVVVRLDESEPPADSSLEDTLFSATLLPLSYSINTLRFEDGAYDLIISAKTRGGVTSELTERVVIKNWEVLEDEILPPKALGWFGIRDSLKTVGEPKGWVYASDDAELFFGDGDRIMRGQASVEPLTWRIPNLYQYVLTIYAKETEIRDDVIVEVSSDGVSWIEVPYEIHVVYPEGSLDFSWVKMDLNGLAPKDIGAQLLRVMFTGRSIPPGDLQLGHVYLAGVSNPASLQLLPY